MSVQMEDSESLGSMDGLLLQLALQTREISQRRDKLNQQIQISKSNVAGKKSYIEGIQRNIKTLEKESQNKQNIVKHLKDNSKSLKSTNSLLLQYEKSMQAELERRLDHCNQEMKVYQERIESYRKVYQQHKECYSQIPLAKKLLLIQGDKEEIESRIKECDEQIVAKQNVLQDLLGQSLSIENPMESIVGLQTANDCERHSEPPIKNSLPSPQGISCLNLSQTSGEPSSSGLGRNGHDKQGAGVIGHNQEKNLLWETPAALPANQEPNCDLSSNRETVDTVQVADQMPSPEHPKEVGLEEHLHTSGLVEMMDEEVNERESEGAVELPTVLVSEEAEMGAAVKPQTPTRMKAVSSTPTFSLNSSTPSGSPCQPNSSMFKSPGFVFSLVSDPSPATAGFSGFHYGFDMGSTPEESPFSFTNPYFSSEKKPSGSKSPTGFLFAQPESEKSQDGFEFTFSSRSPGHLSARREKPDAVDPFSFHFGKL
ncbi:hypothetical protein UPYG_G00160530 [Umbra pygmaea]|uniref:Uncharacterized protein n=1 Tax=Umbra pygmaea TaxID=75934 RepID=A0ABD0X385_UMBPY